MRWSNGRALRFAVLAAAFLTSCNRSVFKSGAACKAEGQQASDWVSRLVAEGDGGWHARPADFEGVVLESPGEWGAEWPQLVLTPTAGTVDGTAAWKPGRDMQELRFILRAKRELYQQSQGSDKQMWVHLSLDRRATWALVVDALDAVRGAGAAGLHMVFDAKSSIEPPPKSKRSAELHGYADNASRLVDVWLDPKSPVSVLKECKGAPSPDEKLSGRENLERLAKALPDCGCGVDPTAAREAFWLALRRHQGPPRSFVSLRLAAADDPAAAKVELASSLSWGDAHPKVVAAARARKPIHVAVAKVAAP